MTEREYLLTCLAEECMEVAQRAMKAQRFGLDETQREHPLDNAARIRLELADLFGTLELLEEREVMWIRADSAEFQANMNLKKVKLKKYMDYSRDLGTLHD